MNNLPTVMSIVAPAPAGAFPASGALQPSTDGLFNGLLLDAIAMVNPASTAETPVGVINSPAEQGEESAELPANNGGLTLQPNNSEPFITSIFTPFENNGALGDIGITENVDAVQEFEVIAVTRPGDVLVDSSNSQLNFLNENAVSLPHAQVSESDIAAHNTVGPSALFPTNAPRHSYTLTVPSDLRSLAPFPGQELHVLLTDVKAVTVNVSQTENARLNSSVLTNRVRNRIQSLLDIRPATNSPANLIAQEPELSGLGDDDLGIAAVSTASPNTGSARPTLSNVSADAQSMTKNPEDLAFATVANVTAPQSQTSESPASKVISESDGVDQIQSGELQITGQAREQVQPVISRSAETVTSHAIHATTPDPRFIESLNSGETDRPLPSVRFGFSESPLAALHTPGKSIQITMHPEHLGRATLTINLQGDQVTARIVVASEEARALVEHSLEDLLGQLQRSQVSVDQIVVSAAGQMRADVNYDRHTRSGKWHRPHTNKTVGRIASPTGNDTWLPAYGIPNLQSGSINLVA